MVYYSKWNGLESANKRVEWMEVKEMFQGKCSKRLRKCFSVKDAHWTQERRRISLSDFDQTNLEGEKKHTEKAKNKKKIKGKCINQKELKNMKVEHSMLAGEAGVHFNLMTN